MCAQAFIIGNIITTRYKDYCLQRNTWYISAPTDCRGIVNGIEEAGQRKKIIITCTSTKKSFQKAWLTCHDHIAIYSYKKNIMVGDHIYIQSMHCMPAPIDIQKKLFQQKLIATSFQFKKLVLNKRPKFCLSRIMHNTRLHIKKKIEHKLSPLTRSIFYTIFLGKKDQNTAATKNPFIWWGIVHYLARSGLHLLLIFISLSLVAGFVQLPFCVKDWGILTICMLYYFFSWSSISFIRALLLIVGYQLCTILRIPIRTIHLLNITILLCLIYNPMSLFALDFQLTFALTYALALTKKPKTKNLKTNQILHQQEKIS